MNENTEALLQKIAKEIETLKRGSARGTERADFTTLDELLDELARTDIELQEVRDGIEKAAASPSEAPSRHWPGRRGIAVLAVVIVLLGIGGLVAWRQWNNRSAEAPGQASQVPEAEQTTSVPAATIGTALEGTAPESPTEEVPSPAPTPDPTPELNLTLTGDNLQVEPGGTAMLTLEVINEGDSLVRDLTVFVTLPDGITLTGNNSAEMNGSEASWSIGGIAPGAPNPVQLTVMVDAQQTPDTEFTLSESDYGVRDSTGETLATGSQAVTLTVIPPSPTQLSLEADTSEIPADGISTIILTATLLDAQNNPVTSEQTISYALDSPDVGVIDSGELTTQDGRAETTFTAGITPATVIVRANSGSLSAETTITLTPPRTGSLTMNAHLYLEPAINDDLMLIREMLIGVPFKFLPGVEGEMQQVAIALWIQNPDTNPALSLDETGDWATITAASGARIGDSPDAGPAVTTQAAAVGQRFRVLQSQDDWIQIEVQGWVASARIQEDQ